MKYAQHVVDGEVRFCCIKRRGPKNTRVVSLVTGEDYLVPSLDLEAVTPQEAGVEAAPEPADLPPLPEQSLAGEEVCRLMTGNQVTIKKLADRLGIAEDEVRHARRDGLDGLLIVHDWKQAIAGESEANETADELAA